MIEDTQDGSGRASGSDGFSSAVGSVNGSLSTVKYHDTKSTTSSEIPTFTVKINQSFKSTKLSSTLAKNSSQSLIGI